MNVRPSTLETRLASPEAAGNGTLQQASVELRAHWLPTAPALRLRALFDVRDGHTRLLLTDRSEDVDALLRTHAAGAETPGSDTLAQIATALDVPLFDPDGPCALRPRVVAKPWGHERWYTGIESRAVCGVAVPATGGPEHTAAATVPNTGRTSGRASERNTERTTESTSGNSGEIPLPWLLAALPARYGGIGEPILLKILDPHAEPVRGDLYFELHERKQEVYVVTHIDPRVWPEGRGAIRMGFDPAQLQTLGEAGLRSAFAAAVAAYRPVRMQIDAQLDAERAALGITTDAVVDPDTARGWELLLPAALVEAERKLRARIEALTALVPLRVGDVVRIPRRVPHALQHGVRVVEFQTPVYERQILYFAQKVLTQSHWDTESAIAQMRLRPPASEPPTVEHEADEARAERIADFDGFRVLRITLAPGARCPLPVASHAVLMGLDGRVRIAGACVAAQQALLIPGAALGRDVSAADDTAATCLVALPGSAASAKRPLAEAAS